MDWRWVEKKPGQWWHAQVVDGEPWLGVPEATVMYPPDMYVDFAPSTDGMPLSEACWHLRKLYNGKMPDDPGAEDEDYWHLCGMEGANELIGALRDLLDTFARHKVGNV